MTKHVKIEVEDRHIKAAMETRVAVGLWANVVAKAALLAPTATGVELAALCHEAFGRAQGERQVKAPMEASCDCGGEVEVRRDDGLGIIDYHCIKCGASTQTYDQDDGTLKLRLYPQYRRVTDP